MTRIIKWSVLALLAYVVFLIAKLPANQLLGRINLPTNVIAENVTGTLWQGRIASLFVNNIAVENVHWNLSFWQLLLGNAELDLKAGNIRSSNKVSFSGPININLFNPKQIEVQNFTLYVPANMILAQVKLPVSADATGRLKVTIDRLNYPEKCLELNGKGQWIKAGLEGIQGLSAPLDLGTFNADLSCIEDDVLVTIREPNIFGLNADARIPNNLKISLDARFKPSTDLPQQVLNAAKFFGRTDEQGYYNFKL